MYFSLDNSSINSETSHGNFLIQEERPLIQVNEHGEYIALCRKEEAHKKGILHSAFSLFIYDNRPDGRYFLLQQRALSKYHSGGLWTNTCCSHPWPGLSLEHCILLRLQEEMGIKAQKQDLIFQGNLLYNLPIGSQWEHEWSSLYELPWKAEYTIHPDNNEVHNWGWFSKEDIEKNLREKPNMFTSWFPLVFHFLYPMM